MNFDEYSRLDGMDLARLVRHGEVTRAELRVLALEAIEALNPALNAVIGLAGKGGGERAPDEAPFAGVPFLVKDLGSAMVAGMPNESGSRLAAGSVARDDSEIVRRYRRAGVDILGRTNTPEFGLNPSTEPVLYGPTRNPFDLSRSPGGSSGGSAAAVAAGIVPMAHGTDGGGSIRCPASACGLFGLKPSRGRMPTGPYLDEIAYGICVEHVLTRSVRDSASMLDATAGPDIGARLFLPDPPRSFLEASGRDPKPLRIAVVAEPPSGGPPLHAEVREGLERAVRLCAGLGHDLIEASFPISAAEIVEVFADIHAFAFVGELPAIEAMTGRRAGNDNLEWASQKALERGRAMRAEDFERMQRGLNAIARRMGRFFADFDVLLSPVLGAPPPRLGYMNANDRSLDYWQMTAKFFEIIPYTPIFNLTGQPAMSVPMHRTAEGLPIGMQFAARLGEEATLLSLAGQIERAAPWTHHRPPILAGGLPRGAA